MEELLELCEDSDECECDGDAGLEIKRQRLVSAVATAAPPAGAQPASQGSTRGEIKLVGMAAEARKEEAAAMAAKAAVHAAVPPPTASRRKLPLTTAMMHRVLRAMPEFPKPKEQPSPAAQSGAIKPLPAGRMEVSVDALMMPDALSGIRVDLQSRRLSPNQVKELAMVHEFHRVEKVRCGVAFKGDEAPRSWFTTAVLVEKADPKMTKNGEPFSRWGLSDLSVDGTEREATMTLFLFHGAHGENWKSLVGEVFIIINAAIMYSKDVGNTRVSYKVELPDQVQRIGRATDFRMCSVSGCKAWLCFDNDSGQCKYHAAAAIRRMTGKRGKNASTESGLRRGSGRSHDGKGPFAITSINGQTKWCRIAESKKPRLQTARRDIAGDSGRAFICALSRALVAPRVHQMAQAEPIKRGAFCVQVERHTT